MASIDYPRNRPRVRWRDPDGTPRARTCESEKAAKDLLRQVQYAEDTGRIWQPEAVRQTTPLREIGAAWLRSIHTRLSEKTAYNHASNAETFITWYEQQNGVGADASHLSQSMLEAYWNHLRATGRWGHNRIVATCHKHMVTVHLLWEWAESRDVYEGEIPRPRRMDLPPVTLPPPRPAPTWAEMDACISAGSGWRRCVLVVMRCTGLRAQQVMRLRWEHVMDGMLYMPGELGKSQQERSGRVVPVAPCLLREWKERQLCAWTDDTWIVPCPHEHRLIRPRDVGRIWEMTGARRATWEGRPDHCFRAGFQTGLRAMGFSRELTEYLVGHAMPGVDIHYIDPLQAMPLTQALNRLPPLPGQDK